MSDSKREGYEAGLLTDDSEHHRLTILCALDHAERRVRREGQDAVVYVRYGSPRTVFVRMADDTPPKDATVLRTVAAGEE